MVSLLILKTVATTFIVYFRTQTSGLLRFLRHAQEKHKQLKTKSLFKTEKIRLAEQHRVECLSDSGLSPSLNTGACHCTHSGHAASPDMHPSATLCLIHLVLLKQWEEKRIYRGHTRLCLWASQETPAHLHTQQLQSAIWNPATQKRRVTFNCKFIQRYIDRTLFENFIFWEKKRYFQPRKICFLYLTEIECNKHLVTHASWKTS